MHDAAVNCAVPGTAAVQATTIIPHDQVTRLPSVTVDVLLNRGGICQFSEKRCLGGKAFVGAIGVPQLVPCYVTHRPVCWRYDLPLGVKVGDVHDRSSSSGWISPRFARLMNNKPLYDLKIQS